MSVFSNPEFDHESVHFHEDRATGLRAIIAIHNRNLGPAIGGTRLKPYASEAEALTDVLRLSRGMTYKCAIGGIPFGGGKAVILARPEDKTPDLLRAFGRFVDGLGGRYVTSFDVGTTLGDVRIIGEATRHVGGITEGAGDAADSTAMGVFECLKVAAAHRWPGRPLADVRVAIQGVGSVGERLARLLRTEGAALTVCDALPARAEAVGRALGAEVVAADAILTADCDILAPCALGGILDDASVAALRAEIVVGGANNQLARPEIGEALRRRDILYVPDYLANAGGIVDLHYQLNAVPRSGLPDHLAGLGRTLAEVIATAEAEGVATSVAADRVAEARFAAARPPSPEAGA